MPSLSVPIPDDVLRMLSSQAALLSCNTESYASKLLTEAVKNTELAALRKEVRDLRKDLLVAVKGILVTAHGVNEDAALKWLETTMMPKLNYTSRTKGGSTGR